MNMYNGVFGEQLTPESSYWLGFIAGDGSVGKYGRSYRFSLGLKAEDIQHVRNLASFLGYDISRVKIASNGAANFQVNNKQLFFDLNNLGIKPRKGLEMTEDVFPFSHRLEFVSGLFDADGSIGIYERNDANAKRFNITFSGRRSVIEGIENELDISGSIHSPHNNSCYSLQYQGRGNTVKVGKKIFNDNLPMLPRKTRIFKDMLLDLEKHGLGRRIEKKYDIYKNGRPYIKIICQNCGKSSEKRADHANRPGLGKYCGRRCANARTNR